VIFHPPIDPKDFGNREFLMEKVRSVIEAGLPEEYRQESLTTEDTGEHGGTAQPTPL
jgi:hypothetical protein